MAYKFIVGRPLAREVSRLLDQEIAAATTSLRCVAAGSDAGRVHETRRHLKKASALIHVARRSSGHQYPDAADALRTANRALGPLADAGRVLETLAAARREGIVHLPMPAYQGVRAWLESRASAIEQTAAAGEVHIRTIRLLAALHQEVETARLHRLERAAVVAEIRAAHAAARQGRRRAMHTPSVDSFHRWRHPVKREWHLMRLVSDLTGNRLNDERHQLAALDSCLGDLHDIDVLAGALDADVPLTRVELARVIRSLRAHASHLRQLACRLSAVLDETPRELARRVRALWGALPRRPDGAPEPTTWPHSA